MYNRCSSGDSIEVGSIILELVGICNAFFLRNSYHLFGKKVKLASQVADLLPEKDDLLIDKNLASLISFITRPVPFLLFASEWTN